MTQPDVSAASAAPASWWRRQRLWLLGAVLLGAWALYAPYRDAWQGYARMHPMQARDVPAAQSVAYEGARWRLLNVTERDLPNQRDDAMVLVARFEVVADAGTTAKQLNRCKSRISDAHGRVWNADAFNQLGVKHTLPQNCGSGMGADFKTSEAQPGSPWLFEQVYQVPRGVDAKTLRPEIFMPWPEHEPVGRYLRFSP
jgi:hypothetical protein